MKREGKAGGRVARFLQNTLSTKGDGVGVCALQQQVGETRQKFFLRTAFKRPFLKLFYLHACLSTCLSFSRPEYTSRGLCQWRGQYLTVLYTGPKLD